MSPTYTGEWGFIISTALVIAFRAFIFKRLFWDAPLNHGPGFFLGVEVEPGFYEGEGVRWLSRYHQAWFVEISLEALMLVGVIIMAPRLLFPWWVLLPFWAVAATMVAAATISGFVIYARKTLGAHPPVRPSFAIPLETRRLSDYISWPHEALLASITVAVWALLLVNWHRQPAWQAPFLMTYIAIGLFPFKVEIVRESIPLPADRPEEHYQWMEAKRRLALYHMDLLRWFFLFFFADYALLHCWHPWIMLGPGSGLRWSVMGALYIIGVYYTWIGYRRARRVAAMGRNLRPEGSWRTPFRPATLMMSSFRPWFAAWYVGLILLLVFLRP